MSQIDRVILIIWSVFLTQEFFADVSTINTSSLQWVEMLSKLLCSLLVACCLIKLIYRRNTLFEYVIPGTLILLLLVIRSFVDGYFSGYLLILVVAMYGIEFERIAKIYLIVVGSCLFITSLFSILGIVGMSISDGGRFTEYRYAFGTAHPNGLGCIVLLLFCCLIYLFYSTEKILYVIGAEILNFALFSVIQSMSFFGIVTIGLTVCLIEFISRKYDFSNHILMRIIRIMVMLSPLLIVITCFGCALYIHIFGTQSPAGVMGTLQSRINFVGQAFEKYPVKLFGTDIPYVSLSLSEIYQGDIFLLDNGWMAILFSEGIIEFIVYFGILQISSIRAFRNKSYSVCILILMFSMEMFMENFLTSFVYGLIWLTLFASFKSGRGKVSGFKNEEK